MNWVRRFLCFLGGQRAAFLCLQPSHTWLISCLWAPPKVCSFSTRRERRVSARAMMPSKRFDVRKEPYEEWSTDVPDRMTKSLCRKRWATILWALGHKGRGTLSSDEIIQDDSEYSRAVKLLVLHRRLHIWNNRTDNWALHLTIPGRKAMTNCLIFSNSCLMLSTYTSLNMKEVWPC